MGDVTLRIAGIDYQGWHAISVQRSIEQAAAQFAATVSEPTSGAAAPLEGWNIRPGAEVVVLVDGEAVVTGYIDAVAPRFDAHDHTVDISGRSKTADMVDSAAIVEGGQFKNLTIVEIAKRLAEPFGITVDVSDVPESALAPIPDVQIQQGETAYAVVERLCRLQGILACDGAGGIFRLARVGSRRADVTLQQGGNIESAGASLDLSERFSAYVVKGQRANTDDRKDRASATDDDAGEEPDPRADDDDGHDGGHAGHSVRATRGEFKDTGVTRYRPMLLTAEMQSDDSTCQRRAEWEARRRAGKGLRATFVLGGWRQKGETGPLWDVNLLVPIVAPWLGLDRELVIASVEYRKDESGTSTALEVTLPDAFLPEEDKTKKTKTKKDKKNTASGVDVSGNADLWAPDFVPGD